MFKRSIIILCLLVPVITYWQSASSDDLKNARNMANYYCSTDIDWKTVAWIDACVQAQSSYKYTQSSLKNWNDYDEKKYENVSTTDFKSETAV